MQKHSQLILTNLCLSGGGVGVAGAQYPRQRPALGPGGQSHRGGPPHPPLRCGRDLLRSSGRPRLQADPELLSRGPRLRQVLGEVPRGAGRDGEQGLAWEGHSFGCGLVQG